MPGRHAAAPKHSLRTRLAALAVAVLAVGGVIAGVLASGSGGSGHSTQVLGLRATRPPAATPSVAPVTTPTPPPATRPPARPSRKPHHKPATLDVRITGRAAYVEVRRADGRRLYLGTLRHGAHRWFNESALRVVIGDAGATRLVIRGKVHAPAGREGEVLRFVITPRGVRGY